MNNHLLRIGDILVQHAKIDGLKQSLCHTDGSNVTLVDFHQSYIGRGHGNYAPGIRADHDYIVVQYEDGSILKDVSASHFRLANRDEYNRRVSEHLEFQERYHYTFETEYAAREIIAELPNSPFWEGDYVKAKIAPADDPQIKDSVAAIHACEPPQPSLIDFSRIMIHTIEYCPSVDKTYFALCGYKEGYWPEINRNYWLVRDQHDFPHGCWDFGFTESDLELIERGRIWKFYHDEPIKFYDLADEAEFADTVGQRYYISPEDHGPFDAGKPFDDCIAMVRDGLAHGIEINLDCKTDKIRAYRVVRFRDKSLGERVAKATVKDGLLLTPLSHAL